MICAILPRSTRRVHVRREESLVTVVFRDDRRAHDARYDNPGDHGVQILTFVDGGCKFRSGPFVRKPLHAPVQRLFCTRA
ncbi:hypothetical protein CFB50_20645 [Burkholderia sp. AU33423]|nr:hypothetical protein CFB50_20645 [Burkholderia sp. AU33423]